jgi:hypothetical protein
VKKSYNKVSATAGTLHIKRSPLLYVSTTLNIQCPAKHLPKLTAMPPAGTTKTARSILSKRICQRKQIKKPGATT